LFIILLPVHPSLILPATTVQTLPGYRMLFPVTGTPPIQTVIMQNDTILGDMESVSLYEEGNYSCVANGVYGSDRKNFSVTFKGKTLNIHRQTLFMLLIMWISTNDK